MMTLGFYRYGFRVKISELGFHIARARKTPTLSVSVFEFVTMGATVGLSFAGGGGIDKYPALTSLNVAEPRSTSVNS